MNEPMVFSSDYQRRRDVVAERDAAQPALRRKFNRCSIAYLRPNGLTSMVRVLIDYFGVHDGANYACGSGYVKYEYRREVWALWGSCLHPRPLAILAVARYWTWDEEPWALAARDALRAAWLRNAHERLHIRL